MSALPPKADIEPRNVRFVPKADICSAAKTVTLLNQLVGGCEYGVVDRDTQRVSAAFGLRAPHKDRYRNCSRKKATFATRPGSSHWKRRTTERTSPSDALLRAVTRNASPRKLP